MITSIRICVRWGLLGESEYDTLSMAVVGAAYYTGRGFNQDYEKAIEYFKRAGEEPIALYHLSDAYLNGNGVDKDLKKAKFYADYMKLVSQARIDKYRAKMQRKKDRKDAKEERKAERSKADQPTEDQSTEDQSTVEDPTFDRSTKDPTTVEEPTVEQSTKADPTEDYGVLVPYPFSPIEIPNEGQGD